MRTEPVRELLDPRHPVVAALFDDVGRTVLAGQSLAWLVAAHRDDPLRAELLGGQHGEQADRAVTDDGNGPTRAGLGGDGSKPACAEHVGRREQARDEIRRGDFGGGYEGAVGERYP